MFVFKTFGGSGRAIIGWWVNITVKMNRLLIVVISWLNCNSLKKSAVLSEVSVDDGLHYALLRLVPA